MDNILRVKTTMPPSAAALMQRPQLLERLESGLIGEQGLTRRLTLFSAPAGFGKTTTARAWLTAREYSAAWYSIDPTDNEFSQFWTYVATALRTHSSDVGRGTLEILRSGDSGGDLDGRNALIPLLNDLFDLDIPHFLVLDDYHAIDNSKVHGAMRFFIENLPPNLHVVVTTRSDPPWPLARWRARGDMVEIRGENLKLTREESEELLTDLHGLSLDGKQARILHQKADGWVTGLQLAAFSLAHTARAEDFIRDFAGSHRHVFHFLADEVFTVQPPRVQEFLLQTSILERLNPSLCDAVTEGADGSDVLERLLGENVFVLPQDASGYWFRYHPLFADLLQVLLRREFPDLVPALHLRAAHWLVTHGEYAAALSHTLRTEDVGETARIAEVHFEDILREGGPGLLLRCLHRVPPETLEQHPTLAVHLAYLRLIHRGGDGAREYLALAESAGIPEGSALDGKASVVRAYLDIYDHGLERARVHARRAEEWLPVDDRYWRVSIDVLAGDTYLFAGNPGEAQRHYARAHAINVEEDNAYLSLSTGFKLATSLYHGGDLATAQALVDDLIGNSAQTGLQRVSRMGVILTLRGEILRERGRLDEAETWIERGLNLSESEKPSLGWNYLSRVALHFSKGDLVHADRDVQRIEELNDKATLPSFITLPASLWKARIAAACGDTDRALAILAGVGVSRETPTPAGLEWASLLLTQIFILDDPEDVTTTELVLKRLGEMMDPEVVPRALWLELLLTEAAAAERSGRRDVADGNIRRAARLALNDGYFHLLVDFLVDLKTVWRRLAQSEAVAPDLAALAYGILEQPKLGHCAEFAAQTPTLIFSEEAPVESLTAREQDVLSLMVAGLSNREIAASLVVSEGTVKWHSSNIYGKLGVRNRTEALLRAQEKGLTT